MNVLLCGASGFLGRYIQASLLQMGHHVLAAGTAPGAAPHMRVDYAQDTEVASWLPRLAGVDVVINAVGVLRDTRRRPLTAIHQDAPIALFEACKQVGSTQGRALRVIQISALGVDGNTTRYASTKRAADDYLLALHAAGQVVATILRPSIVFGKGGQSSQLFVHLSKLPFVLLPQAVMTAKVQPVAVVDLARAVALLTATPHPAAMIECVGQQVLSLQAFIAQLRAQQDLPRARVRALPQWATTLSVRIGDQLAMIPWCSETAALLATDNVSASGAFDQLLGYTQLPVNNYWRDAWQI